MRIVLVSLLVLTVISIAAAETTTWVFPGEPYTFEGETYYAFPDSAGGSIILESNSTTLILDEDECERKSFTRYCYYEQAATDDFDHVRFDTGNDMIRALKISFESLGPNVKLKQGYSTTAPDVNGRVDGTITVSNTGNQAARAVLVSWSANGSVSLRTCSECEESRRSFSRRYTTLGVGDEETITFSFTVNDAAAFTTQSNVTFEYEGQSETIGPANQGFSIKKPYSASMAGASSTQVGEWIDASFTVKNTGDNDIIVNAVPDENASLRYESERFSTIETFENLELAPGESETYEFRARSTTAGTYGTGVSLTINRGDETFEETLRKNLVWTLDDVKLSTSIGKRAPVSGDSNRISVSLENTGTLTFEDLELSYDGEISGERVVEYLGTGRRVQPVVETFTHPEVDELLEREIAVNLTYDTRFGEEQTTSQVLRYTIVPMNKSYTLRKTISPKEPAIDEEFTVTVYGRKTVDSAVLYSEVADRIIGGTILRGNNRLTPFESDKEERLYQYEGVRTSERFAVITSVDVSFDGQEARIRDVYSTFNLSESQVDETIDSSDAGTVEEPEPETNETQPEPEPEEQEMPSAPEPEEEPGFFGRILSWFANLFG